MNGRILIVDDHVQARQSMADTLRHAGHQVHTCSGAAEALRWLSAEPADLVITDLKMPGMDGLEFLKQLQRTGHEAQVLVVTAHATIATAVEAMREGAADYIEKPFSAGQLESVVARALRTGPACRHHPRSDHDEGDLLVGSSRSMQALRERIRQVAATDETVLIMGESGTGKELVARRIHATSPRAHRPMISLNCPALSPQLMESELFGHERGAFTGADQARIGRFELADGGTLLLDEITEIDPALQAKLLRVLQEKTFERVGSSSPRRTDVRVLATTNRRLDDEVRAGRFRQDLFYRLHVLPIHVPPLREHAEDIPELVEHFRRQAARRLGGEPVEFTADALQWLRHYHWPGNVRELENLITRLSVLHPDRQVTAQSLPDYVVSAPASNDPARCAIELPIRAGMSLQEMERRLIEATLEYFNGHRLKAAQALGIGVRTLTNKLRAYGYAPRTRHFARSA
ncbi:MAG: acetoacetate metabolism regulatory protein AtoC [Pirellulaceae bacterium]|nr:MAG: acetoacetate metabolism regulatory protein AtoC [Pirellulaceae bacterium]